MGGGGHGRGLPPDYLAIAEAALGYNQVGRKYLQEAAEASLSKEDSIEVTGTVVEKFPSGLFSVQLDQERIVLAHLAGKLRRNRIRVLAGDRVTLEMSPYDLTKGRITYRHK
jgi:translation initiation factor IF-1